MHPAANSHDTLQWIFFGTAGLFVLYQMACGWERGVMRQAVHLVAILISYAVAWVGGPKLVPLLRSLGYPDMVLSALGGCGLALVVYTVITYIGSLFFKKTAKHESRLVHLRYGAGGALLGMFVGLVFVWIALLGVRIAGTAAKSRIAMNRIVEERKNQQVAEEGEAPRPPEAPNIALSSIADMKDALDNGVAGPVIKEVDPLPPEAYMVVSKMTAVLSDIDTAKRFMEYPGAQELVGNPKITALSADPGVVEQAKARNILALMKNPVIVKAMNDPALVSMVQKFPIEKALDYALSTTQKDVPAGNNN